MIFIEGQAFSRSYGLAPRPPPPILSVGSTGDGEMQEDWVRETTCWKQSGGGGEKGEAEEPNHTTVRQLGLSINHSMISDFLMADTQRMYSKRNMGCLGPYAEAEYNLNLHKSTPTHLPWAALCQSRLYPPVMD